MPGRDSKWKEETIRNTSEVQFTQEFECEFVGSTYTLIAPIKSLEQWCLRVQYMKIII